MYTTQLESLSIRRDKNNPENYLQLYLEMLTAFRFADDSQ